MDRLKHAKQLVNHNEFNFENIYDQEIPEDGFEFRSNTNDKEASCLRRKNKVTYCIDPTSDECTIGFELEMEDTIVNLNNQIQILHEELEGKKLSVAILQNELSKSKTSMEELQDELACNRTTIHELKEELESKNTNIIELTEELSQKNLLLKEVGELKNNFNESVKRIVFLEESLGEKSEALEVNTELLNNVKIELDHELEAAFIREQEFAKEEQELRAKYDNEICNLQQQYSDQLKNVLDNNCLKEKFLEKQIEMLFNRIEELTERGQSHQQEYETVKRMYEEEYNEMKSKVDEISKSSGSHIQDLNNRLAGCLSNEVAYKVELKSRIDNEKKTKQELINIKKKWEESLINEKNLCQRLQETEMQLNLLNEEKETLRNQCINANNLYDQLNDNYARERNEILQEQKRIIDSYENDLSKLIKVLKDLHHCIDNIYFNYIEDLSYSESDESLVTLPFISKEAFSNKCFYGAMKIVCDSMSGSMKLRKEFKNLVQDSQHLRVAFEARKKNCEENAQQMAALQNEIMTLEKEKDFAVNNLRYFEEQNDRLKYEKAKNNDEIALLNHEMNRYKEEYNKLNQQRNEEVYVQFADADLSPIRPDYKEANEGEFVNPLHIHLRAPPHSANALVQLAASTPCHRNICDPEGGGEFVKSKPFKSKTELHSSLVKWMEKCHELDRQNKHLNANVEGLSLEVHNLKLSSQLLKEEMNAYEEARSNLEEKLSNYGSLRERFTELQDENEKLTTEVRSLVKELDYIRNENQQLSETNVQIEKKYNKYIAELTERKTSENHTITNEALINNFNEKLHEIVRLKGEIKSLCDAKRYLTHRVDLLLEANDSYSAKIDETYDELNSCKNDLETMRNEKMDLCSSNRLLNKEVQLLQLRVDYVTSLRDIQSSAASVAQTEDLFQELILFARSVMDNKIEGNSSSEMSEEEKANQVSIQEILKTLNHQLNEEKLDFDGKLIELQDIINMSKKGDVTTDDWILQLDKKLRTIIEEMKFHKEQYNRIEEALRSTGKFHDELQKQKDQLRAKDHEISSLEKRITEEKMQIKKLACHIKYLQQELEEKNEIISITVDQKVTLEKELKEFQSKLCDVEKKYEIEIKAAEWKLQQAKLSNLENEVERKFILTQKDEKWLRDDFDSENWQKVRDEVEKIYQNALQQVQYFFNAEVSSNVAQVQEEHKEQIAEFQRIIDEQAIKIGILMKKNILEDGLNNDAVFINEEFKKQFDLATYALQQLHQEEIQLLKLQLEAEKHYEIYRNIYENQQNSIKERGICLNSTVGNDTERNLSKKLESALLEHFISKLKNFVCDWHSSYTKEVINIKNKLQSGIDEHLNKNLSSENLKKIDNNNQQFLNDYSSIVTSAKEFLFSLEIERDHIIENLNNFVEKYNEKTVELFEQINLKHSEKTEILSIQEELTQARKEKEELEKMHKNAIELLNADHKSEQAKIQNILTEIKQCFESGCDPNALIKLRDDLEVRHRKELEDLRTYFEEKCTNLGKQYSEDVNSLHSRMLSLSSSCSDEIMSDHLGFDRGAAGDNNFIFSEMEAENISTLDKLTTDQYKLIEELNCKWSENVKEMKKELEKKYSKKIEQLQEKLSTFVYNNELDVTVRCIKEDVMRDCKIEIDDIKKEISARMIAAGEYADDYNDLFKNHDEQLAAAFSERDAAWEQIVEIMGHSLSQEAINKITIQIIWDTLKKCDIREKIISNVSDLWTSMEEKLSVITVKLKDKESKLLNLQNKMNTCSQLYTDALCKIKNYNQIIVNIQLLENPKLLEKFVEEDSVDESMPSEIIKIKNIVKHFYENKLSKEKEKESIELESIKTLYSEKDKAIHCYNSQLMEKLMRGDFEEQDWPPEIIQIKNTLQEIFEKKLVKEMEKNTLELENLKQLHQNKKSEKNVPFSENSDLNEIIQERDHLKEMTVTLKTAVGQLVSYLNTCEDELNKTVVEELLKVYLDTPKKANLSTYESLECSPELKKVHFAPDVGICGDLDSSHDISAFLQIQLDSCLSKLKVEAASLLGLSALQPPPANLNKQIENLRKENEELLQEMADLKLRLYKHQNDSLELRDQFSEEAQSENSVTYLQDKAQQLLINGAQNNPQELTKTFEDLAKLGDNLIHDLQKEKADLQLQIEAADKQLKSTRQFLEEQAVERETERDDYSKEILNLQAQLKEKGKNISSHERITTQVEELELQLKESNVLLDECEKKKCLVEAELKDAIDKVWVLRDIISDLETQLSNKSEKEALLEQKLDELETELDQQNGTQYAMVQELESLRSQSLDEGYLEQIKQLEENIKVQFNSTVVRQLKSQLQELEKTLALRTKELETVYLNNSSNSLSSPSEEVSVREQLEWSRSRTPEQCPSPVSLPVDEVSRLQDKIVRHFRAEEMLVKRLRDQQLITVKLQVELEEMHAERDVLQKHKKKQMVLLAEANNKIDDLRHKVETAQTAANKDLISQIQELKEKYSKVEQALESTHNQLIEHKIQLSHAEEIITKQKIEISNLAQCDHEVVDSLRLELAAVTAERNKLEDLLDKYRRDYNLDVVNALLVDKNEDIDHLQHTVAMLQSQKGDDNHGSRNSKGHRVSFATDIENSNSLGDDMRLRDAPNMQSLNLYPENTFQVFGEPISPIPRENEKQLSTSLKSFSLSDQSILDRTNNEPEDKLVLANLKQELQEKNDRIISLEKEIEYLKSIEKDLKNAETELQALVSSVTEDKKYYENELHFMSEKLSKQDEDVNKLKNSLKLKNEEILKTTADVQALQEISLNLQEKLKEAKQLAEKDNVHLLKKDLAHLNEELLSREKEISDLEQELQLFKTDYNDEKELCETLKSSLNAISTEKQDLEENISLLIQKNNDLSNNHQVTEDRLNHYITAVRNLKNDLSSKTNTFDPKHNSSNVNNASFIENEILTLQEEIVKLINLNEHLFQERNNVLEELNKLKMSINCEDSNTKDSLINQLQDELNDLRKAVHSVKEEKLATFANFSKEICQLHKDLDNLQDSKQVVVQKWKQELLEKQSLKEKFESLTAESEHWQNKQEQRLSLNKSATLDIPPVLPQSKLEKLTFCRSGFVDIQPVSNKCPESKLHRLSFTGAGLIDIQPVSHFPAGMDDLADKMRKEIKLSATLDNSLLESILPESSDEFQGTSETSEGISSHFVTVTSKLRSLEKALLSEMEKARESRNSLRQKEAQYRQSEAEKNEMKLRLEKLGRMLTAHDEKITLQLDQLKMEKDKVITLELMVSKEQASLKKVNSLLEEERSKARESQKEDIALIETMRKRLQNLMENETMLKRMVQDERQKCNNLIAQLNSLRALEQYRSDSEGDSHKNCQKILLQERDKCLQIKVEWEKERRTCEDLREVLTRERTAILYLQDSLTKSEKNRHQVEKEVNVLKQQLSEEHVKRELTDRMTTEAQRIEVSRFQQKLEAIESRNKKSLETAYAVIRELEQEYNDLKIYIRSQQDNDDRLKDQVHLPLIQQLNEVNDNLEALIKERVELKRTIDRLNEENNRLHTLINDLKKMILASGRMPVAYSSLEAPNIRLQEGTEVEPLIQRRTPAYGRLSAASSTSEVSNVRLQGETEVVAPFIQKEVDGLLDRVLLSERHKKALVFQKRYLLVALRGYQDAHAETLYHLQRHRPHQRSRKLSFRSVVLAVIATLKIGKLPLKRITSYHKRRGILLSNLKRSLSRSTAEMERLTSIPTSRQIAPHSPPSRDRATLRLR